MSTTEAAVWHRDGHKVLIMVDGTDVTMTLEYCPFGEREGADCYDKEAGGCIVRWFVNMYEFACNRGTAPASQFSEIAWTLTRGIDLYNSEVLIKPVADEEFMEFVKEQMGEFGEVEE